MRPTHRLILSAPGSGKTTLICSETLGIPSSERVLITTYTESNANEIKQKIIKKRGAIPANITIMPWFSFLLKHGVRPYQGSMNAELHNRRIGFLLSSEKSGYRFTNSFGRPVYWGESDFFKFYFSANLKIYSDKIAKFTFASNKQTDGEIVTRISKIFNHIYIDEVQDLAGWDLELLKCLSKTQSNITLVGDPRQTIYLTNNAAKHEKYRQGKIDQFLNEKCKSLKYEIDTTTLGRSHRNNREICRFSSLLYPEYESIDVCDCEGCNHENMHTGIYLVRDRDINSYLRQFPSQILKDRNSDYGEINYGISKGQTYERVLIHPTQGIKNYIHSGEISEFKSLISKARFFVAITRARHSVAIVYNYKDDEQPPFDLVKKWRG